MEELLMGGLSLLADEERFWRGWRVSVTLFFVRTVYQLTTLPFFIFWLPGLDYLFTGSTPTGYNPIGGCMPKDVAGLSAWLCDLEWRLRGSTVTQDRYLTAEQLAHLKDGVASIQEWLAARRWRIEDTKDRLEATILHNRLQSTLYAFVPRSSRLWQQLFPSEHKCRAYEKAIADSGELHPSLLAEFKANAEKSEKYDVAYQSKDSVSECHLCSGKFFYGFAILRRTRHHCRLCGFVCCDACSRHSRVLACTHRAERVCDVCDSIWHLTRHGPSAQAAATATSGGAKELL